MADLKISQLSSASTPLAGTEVLPIVQSGATVKVSVANLTAGRVTSVGSLLANGATATSVAGSNSAITVNDSVTATDGTSKVQILGQLNYEGLYFKGAYLRVYNDASTGVYLASGATSWTASSDARLKNVGGEIENAVTALRTLTPVSFTWKSDSKNTKQIGLIAQEVQKVIPEIVDVGPDGYLGVRYVELVPVLIAAIKELKAEIDALKK